MNVGNLLHRPNPSIFIQRYNLQLLLHSPSPYAENLKPSNNQTDLQPYLKIDETRKWRSKGIIRLSSTPPNWLEISAWRVTHAEEPGVRWFVAPFRFQDGIATQHPHCSPINPTYDLLYGWMSEWRCGNGSNLRMSLSPYSIRRKRK